MNIDPQTVNPDHLPSFSLERRRALPSIPAIYLAIDFSGVVHYIGRS